MFPSNIELLKHILDEIDFILSSTQEKSQEQTITDPILSRAIIRSLEIIGEASSKLTADFKLVNPQIEWRKLSGTRNRLIHDYFGVDYEIVWDIVISKLPDLRRNIVNILKDLQ